MLFRSKRELEDILSRYPNRQAATIPVLHLCQAEHGWISDEVIDFVARTGEVVYASGLIEAGGRAEGDLVGRPVALLRDAGASQVHPGAGGLWRIPSKDHGATRLPIFISDL